jgi:hypothetical protein
MLIHREVGVREWVSGAECGLINNRLAPVIAPLGGSRRRKCWAHFMINAG